jgi:hypothetical protein
MGVSQVGVPLLIINFITRKAIGKQWGTLLQIAEDVKNGNRIDHQQPSRKRGNCTGGSKDEPVS